MNRPSLERTLPHNIDAEKAIIGAILINNENIYPVAEKLKADDFYLDAHRNIYAKAIDMAEHSQAVDLVTLQAELLRLGKLESSGGIAYIASLMDGLPHLVNIDHYIELVYETSLRRKLINTTNSIMAACFDGMLSGKEILEESEAKIYQLAESREQGGLLPTADLQVEATQRVEQVFSNRDIITGLGTGYRDLDRMTAGLHKGNLVILAARPSVGKSALATNIAQYVAGHGHTVALFSLEMTRLELMLRMVTAEVRVDGAKLRNGYLTKEDFRSLVNGIELLGTRSIYIDDTSSMTAMELRSKCRRLKAEKGLDLVIVDYLQLMSGPTSKRQENRVQEVSQITRSLKGLAKELDVPVLALSQLNRAPEQRKGNARPQLSDLRESGSIEQDADMVMFIYREEMYKPDEENAGLAELIISKQRSGPTGTVRLAFIREYTRFETLMADLT